MIILGLGSNIGNCEENIMNAIILLSKSPCIDIVQVSSLYKSEPVGYTQQPSFINAVVSIRTELPPIKLLDVCLLIEKKMGRVRDIRWGPRIIDIDMLTYDNIVCNLERLVLPHPYLHERSFVLVPFIEIAGNISINGRYIMDLLNNCYNQQVEPYKKLHWNVEKGCFSQ